MSISQLTQTLLTTIVGGIVGGLVVIATNWITARGKRKQDIQEWYERIYIQEGIDPLVAYYQSLSLSIANKGNKKTMHIAPRDIPVEAISKVRILLNAFVPLNIIILAHNHLAYSEDWHVLNEASQIMQQAVEVLLDFRRAL